MTQQEREKILSREALRTKDVADLMGCSQAKASDIIRRVKQSQDRLGMEGFLHIQDYIEFFNLPLERYLPRKLVVFGSKDNE